MYSQRALGRDLDIPHSTLVLLMRGKRKMSVKTYRSISLALKSDQALQIHCLKLFMKQGQASQGSGKER
jgi:hypothetical protein